MFFTAVRQALYKTRWSKYQTIINIDSDVKLQWTSNILWVIQHGGNEFPVYYNSTPELEKEVDNIIHTFNEIDKKNTSDRMIQYLQMRDAERKTKN